MVVWSLRLSTRPSVALEYATILSYVLQKDFVCTELLGELYDLRESIPNSCPTRACATLMRCTGSLSLFDPGLDDDGPLEYTLPLYRSTLRLKPSPFLCAPQPTTARFTAAC